MYDLAIIGHDPQELQEYINTAEFYSRSEDYVLNPSKIVKITYNIQFQIEINFQTR